MKNQNQNNSWSSRSIAKSFLHFIKAKIGKSNNRLHESEEKS